MNQDSIPHPDADFNTWVLAFVNYLDTAHNPALGVTTDQLMALDAGVAAWTHAYGPTTNPATVTSTDVALKNEARAALEAIVRPIIRVLQASPAVTDDMRTSMGLHIPSGTRTRAAVPTTAPQLTIGIGQRLQHSLNIQDAASPHSKAKPPGVKGCEIWAKVGAPAPTDASQMTLVATATHTPYLLNYTGAQAGQSVTYWPRWINTHDETGPWGAPATAIIPG